MTIHCLIKASALAVALASYGSSASAQFTQPDPIGLRGGINPYSYVGANPVNRIDPTGLWATDAHNEIINTYGQQLGLPPEVVAAMKQGSYEADHGSSYQDAYHAYMHAMSSSKLSKAQACKMLNDFVSNSVAKAKAMAAAGDNAGAYKELGFGLHPIMDSTSPVHAGFQEWHLQDFYKHGSFPTSQEDKGSLTPELLKQTVDLMNSAINGKQIDCSCYEK